jgi:hypothetical protein
MDLQKIINEVSRNDTYLNLSSHAQFENTKFITESWEDNKGNLHYKTYHKELKYTMHSKEGRFHNIHGPAIIKANGELEWWYEDQKIASAYEKNGVYKFSDLTPVDEDMIYGRLASLELLTILRARESYDRKLSIEEIHFREHHQKPNNIKEIVDKMREQNSTEKKNFKPK